MTEGRYSPGPWGWTDFGVLSDSNGVALLDHEDWNVSPEDSMLIAASPLLLEWALKVLRDCGDRLPSNLLDEGWKTVARASDVTRQRDA